MATSSVPAAAAKNNSHTTTTMMAQEPTAVPAPRPTTATTATPPEEQVAPPAATTVSDDPLDQLFFADDDDNNNNEDTSGQQLRRGTTASARFNMWSTMVGGGCLSLPLAFQKTGNVIGGPMLLFLTGAMTEFCFYCLVDAARTLHPPGHSATVGRDSYEGLAAAALGPRMYSACTALVTLMCFFGIVGYAVLLRDMLEPVTDAVFSSVSRSKGPSWQDNLTMLTVVVAVTPLCTLQTLTALKSFGAASMSSIGLLGVCVTYRSLQCTLGFTKHQNHNSDTDDHHYSILDGFQLFPDNWKDVLDVIPLFISCYVCHYNIPVVHNELREPTQERVKWWLQSTVWGSTAFYLVLGIAGSAYGACTSQSQVQGNILLDFDEEDPLLLMGRMCLAVTITLAFPMLTIPARDILIRLYRNHYKNNRVVAATSTAPQRQEVRGNETLTAALLEPLLEQPSEEEEEEENVGGDVESAPAPAPADNDDEDEQPEVVQAAASQEDEEEVHTDTTAVETSAAATVEATTEEEDAHLAAPASLGLRLSASVVVFWTGAAVASCVSSIDIVWDLLGSSLSIMLSFLIPCASYLVIARQKMLPQDDSRTRMLHRLSMGTAGLLLVVFVPLMFVSTGNAVYNTFFR